LHLKLGDRGFGVRDLVDLAGGHGYCLTS